MSLEAFGALVKLLYRNISYNYSKYGYTFSQEPIKVEITVAIGLPWLVRGLYVHLKNIYSCSVSSIYPLRLCFIHAVNSCELLELHFPMTLVEIHSSLITKSIPRDKFHHSVISGCIDAFDGFLVVVKCPSMKDSDNNPSSYYSGHYCSHGLNVQVICDASCHFPFLQLLLQYACLIKLSLSVQLCQ